MCGGNVLQRSGHMQSISGQVYITDLIGTVSQPHGINVACDDEGIRAIVCANGRVLKNMQHAFCQKRIEIIIGKENRMT
jgi:hypothetical protein